MISWPVTLWQEMFDEPIKSSQFLGQLHLPGPYSLINRARMVGHSWCLLDWSLSWIAFISANLMLWVDTVCLNKQEFNFRLMYEKPMLSEGLKCITLDTEPSQADPTWSWLCWRGSQWCRCPPGGRLACRGWPGRACSPCSCASGKLCLQRSVSEAGKREGIQLPER